MVEKPAEITAQKLGALRAIILSGNKFTAQLVRTVLPAVGIGNVEVSHEPGHAESELTNFCFDLIIIDAGPASGFDWLALGEMVRGLPDKKQAAAAMILLVSQPKKEEIERAARALIRHVVAKPFTAGALCNHVRAALGLASYTPGPGLAALAAKKPAGPEAPLAG